MAVFSDRHLCLWWPAVATFEGLQSNLIGDLCAEEAIQPCNSSADIGGHFTPWFTLRTGPSIGLWGAATLLIQRRILPFSCAHSTRHSTNPPASRPQFA